MKVIASGSKTILDLTDGLALSVILNANQPRTQIYDENSGTLTPDWSTASGKVMVAPTLYLNNESIVLTDSRIQIDWKRKEGSGAEGNLTDGESVNNGVLTVSKNKLSGVTSGQITYYVYVTYTDSSTATTLSASSEITFAQIRTGMNAHLVSITGDQVFKIAANGLVTPAIITLTAAAQNVKITKWQYKKADGTWADYPTGTITQSILTVAPNHDIWTNNVANLRVLTSDSAVFDTISMYKIADGNGIKEVKVYYGKSANTSDMPSDWNTTIPDVGEGEYLWTKTVTSYQNETLDDTITYSYSHQGEKGDEGTSVTVTAIQYKQGDNATTPPSGTWSDNPVDVAEGKYLWTKTTFSDGKVAYSVAKQGVTGVNGLNNATVYLYQRKSSTPSKPTGNLVYEFATGELTGTLGDWKTEIPSGTDPCYVIAATASSNTATDDIAPGEWSQAIILVQDGAVGADGYNQATVFLYQRKASKPSKPSAAVVYDFTTGKLQTVPSGWSQTVPSADGNPCYVTTAAAISQASTASIAKTAWADVSVLSEETPTVFLTNENMTFAGNKDGEVAAVTKTCNIVAYNGTTKTTPKIGTISGAPDGMTVTPGTAVNNEIPLTIVVADGGTLGGAGEMNGVINIPITSPVNTTLQIQWSKVNNGADGTIGISAFLLSIYSPQGTVFTNGKAGNATSVTLTASFYQGTDDLTQDAKAKYLWDKYVINGESANWETVQNERTGANDGYKLTVNATDVVTSATYRCRVQYDGGDYYYDTITLIDKTDNYQANIESTSGDTFEGGIGDSVLICRVWQNGVEVDPVKSTTYSEEAPSSPTVGTFYYRIVATSHTTSLMRFNGSVWENVTNNDTYKHILTYTWYRRDVNGDPMDGGSPFATGKVIHVTSDDVEGKTTFICQIEDKAVAQFSIRDYNDIIISDTEPEDKVLNKLWLNTGVTPNLLYRYNGTMWIIVNDTDSLRETLEANYTELANSISTTEQNLAEQISNVETVLRSELTLTDTIFQTTFERTVQKSIDQSIMDVSDSLWDYQQTVRKYMRYDASGTLTLGDEESLFKTQLTNQRLSFLENDIEVAYISNRSMYITNARVTDTLSIGTDNGYGYFDWVVTMTGLGLKWRSDEVPAYNSNLSYAIGDRCKHNGVIYECIVAIETPESWNSNHWKEIL